MQSRISYERNVCPIVRLSVRLSVKRVNCNKMKETSVEILAHSSCFPTAALKFCFKTCVAMKFVDDDDDEKWFVGNDPLYLKIVGQTNRDRANTPIFNRYSPVAPQP